MMIKKIIITLTVALSIVSISSDVIVKSKDGNVSSSPVTTYDLPEQH
ncbi:hypothetical protein BN1058_00680 [Paraliobacillus sp. PM-2]|nr:hypothetical protein [Paraliobacillus sp. PM-2]CQR46420.1 hypothetical protein BN1058_00680 [Paraliobacillus sp. PM-2]